MKQLLLTILLTAVVLIGGTSIEAAEDTCYETAGRYCPTPRPTDALVCGPNGEQYRPWAYCGEVYTPIAFVTFTVFTPVPSVTPTPSPTQSLCYQTGGRFGC